MAIFAPCYAPACVDQVFAEMCDDRTQGDVPLSSVHDCAELSIKWNTVMRFGYDEFRRVSCALYSQLLQSAIEISGRRNNASNGPEHAEIGMLQRIGS